jgi:putative membrane protein
MIRLILVVVLIALSITFFFQNRQEEAVLHYFGATTPPTPIYKPILSAFGTGLLIMGLLLFPAWIKLRMELRRTRTALHLAEEELDRLRATQGIPVARPPVPGRENAEDEDAT